MTNASLKRAVRTSRYAIQLVALTAAFSFAAVGSASAATVSISGTFLQVSDTSAATNAIVVRNASVGGTNYTLIIDNNFHIITNNTGGVCTHMGSGYVLYCPNPNNGWTLGKTIAFYGGPGNDSYFNETTNSSWLIGGDGSDTLNLGSGGGEVFSDRKNNGSPGNLSPHAGGDFDKITCGAGSDLIHADASDSILGGTCTTQIWRATAFVALNKLHILTPWSSQPYDLEFADTALGPVVRSKKAPGAPSTPIIAPGPGCATADSYGFLLSCSQMSFGSLEVALSAFSDFFNNNSARPAYIDLGGGSDTVFAGNGNDVVKANHGDVDGWIDCGGGTDTLARDPGGDPAVNCEQ